MNNPKKLSEALALKVIKELIKEALAKETGADVFGDQIATPLPDETDEQPSLDVDDNEFNMRAAEAFNDGVLAPELDEVAPPGFEKVVKALKKEKGVKNPFAVAWAMKNKGEHPHKKSK